MNIKAFKINDVNVCIKITTTKSEAIDICEKTDKKIKKAVIENIVKKLLDIEDIKIGVIKPLI